MWIRLLPMRLVVRTSSMVKVGWSFHALFGVSRKCPTAANSACIICASPRCQSATGLTQTQNEGGQRIQRLG